MLTGLTDSTILNMPLMLLRNAMSTDVPLLLVVVTVAATGGSYVVGIPPASYDVAMAPGRRAFWDMILSV